MQGCGFGLREKTIAHFDKIITKIKGPLKKVSCSNSITKIEILIIIFSPIN